MNPDRSGGLAPWLELAPEVAEALGRARPVVALESTLISHGFAYPAGREVALRSQAAVRERGAVPATVAIRDGRLRVGLSDAEIDELATDSEVLKASRSTLAAALARSGWASTTVAATMLAAHAAGIRVFATGGIGGVHRGALVDPRTGRAGSFDVSADLDELARTPVAVVCAGPKLILDVARTIEALETRGVPVVTLGSSQVPGFWARESGVDSPLSVGTPHEAAGIAAAHLAMGLGGLLVCVPLPEQDAVPRERLEGEIESAVAGAEAAGIGGARLTPWLLARLAERTAGATVRANVSLILNNARVAADLAAALEDG